MPLGIVECTVIHVKILDNNFRIGKNVRITNSDGIEYQG